MLDTETTGVDVFSRVFLVATNKKVFEWRVNTKTRQPLIPSNDREELQSILINSDLIVGHNIKFDYVMLVRTLGEEFRRCWDWNKVEDTLIASHLVNSASRHNLTDLVKMYLGVDMEEAEEELRQCVMSCRYLVKDLGWSIACRTNPLTPSASTESWRQDYWIPREAWLILGPDKVDSSWESVCRNYAECDIQATFAIWKRLTQIIKDKKLESIYRERLRLLPIIAEMELSGVGFSPERSFEMEKDLTLELSRNKRTMEALAKKFGVSLKIPVSGTSNDLRNFIVGFLNVKLKKTDKGRPSICRESLDKALEEFGDYSFEGLFLRALLKYREAAVAREYLRTYQRYYHNNRLYPSLDPCGTKTLRWSCRNPNQQNVSKRESINLRKVFGPPEGFVWYSFDAENIELRIPAFESGEKEMIDVFNSTKPPYYGSYHLLVASIIWEKEFEECLRKGVSFKQEYPQLYKWTKNGNFATIYGASESTINKTFHKENASTIIRQRFQKLHRLSQSIFNFAMRKGYVETIPDKDVDPYRGYPLVIPFSQSGGIKPGVPFNYHIQGTACWWICRAMVETYPLIKSLGAKIILQIHDEILVEVPKHLDHPEFPLKIKSKLESVSGIGIPIKIGWERYEDYWGD